MLSIATRLKGHPIVTALLSNSFTSFCSTDHELIPESLMSDVVLVYLPEAYLQIHNQWMNNFEELLKGFFSREEFIFPKIVIWVAVPMPPDSPSLTDEDESRILQSCEIDFVFSAINVVYQVASGEELQVHDSEKTISNIQTILDNVPTENAKMSSPAIWFQELECLLEACRAMSKPAPVISVLEGIRLKTQIEHTNQFYSKFNRTCKVYIDRIDGSSFYTFWSQRYQDFITETDLNVRTELLKHIHSELLKFYIRYCRDASMVIVASFSESANILTVQQSIIEVWESQRISFITTENMAEDQKIIMDLFKGKVLLFFLKRLPKIYSEECLFSIETFRSFYGDIYSLKYEAESLATTYLEESLAAHLLSWTQQQIMANFSLLHQSEYLQSKVLWKLKMASDFWSSFDSVPRDQIETQIAAIKQQIIQAFISSSVVFKKQRYVSKYLNLYYLGACLAGSIFCEVLLRSLLTFTLKAIFISVSGFVVYYLVISGKLSHFTFQ